MSELAKYEAMSAFGMPNHGNSCFLNAALQALVLTPQFREAVRDNAAFCRRTSVGAALAAVVASVPPDAGAVRRLHDSIHAALRARGAAEDFRPGRQQSASELVTQLLSLLDPPGPPPRAPRPGDDPQPTAERNLVVDDALLARFREVFRCSCGHTWHRTDTSVITSIAHLYTRNNRAHFVASPGQKPEQFLGGELLFRDTDPADPASFAHALRVQVEEVEVRHGTCPHRRARRARMLTLAPRLLVLALPAYAAYGQRRAPPGGWPLPRVVPLGPFVYHLVGRVAHGGGLAGGHYTAAVLRAGGWRHISDASVSPGTPTGPGTYLAVYVRTSQK